MFNVFFGENNKARVNSKRVNETYSNPASPAIVPSKSFGRAANGRAFDISFSPSLGAPHKSLLSDVVACRAEPVLMGANAAAVAKREVIIAVENFMVLSVRQQFG